MSAQENTPTPTKTPATIPLMTGLIAVIVVILFILLILTVNGKLFTNSSKNPHSQDLGISTLKERNIQLRAEANAERAKVGLAPLPKGISSARSMASRILRDATDLSALTIQWQSELEAKSNALTDLQNQLTSRDHNAQSLYAEIAKLKTQLEENEKSSSMVITLQNDLQIAQNQLLTYQKQLAEAQARPSTKSITAIKNQLNESEAANRKFAAQIDALLDQGKNTVSKRKYNNLASELARIKPSYDRQRYEIQHLRTKLDQNRLFIEKEKNLPAVAAKLYTRLKNLGKLQGKELDNAYHIIGKELGARIIHRQDFASGSAEITSDREKMIKNATSTKAKPNAFLLIVGYASKTGNKAGNYELSKQRASTTASVASHLKTPGQEIKAVYLGETDRFDKTNPIKNQICEVWEIDR